MEGWLTNTIGELCDAGGGRVQTGPFGSQLHQSDYQELGVPVVMPADIIGGKIDRTKIARVAESHVDRLRRHKLAKGDIVYGRRGDIGRQALIRDENTGWLCGTGCLRITLGDATVEPEFLHRYLQMPEVIGWIQNQAIGATMPNLNTDILRRVPVSYPQSIESQQKIAAVLSAYDDLIENNKRRTVLLEKMAEEIYREWFVRLRFPGHEKVKLVRGLPEGWRIESIGKLCAKVTDGSHFSPESQTDGKPMASVKDMHSNGFSLKTMRTISDSDFESLKKGDCQPQKNDILIAKDGSYLKHVFVWDHDYEVVILSSIAILRSNPNEVLPYFLSLVLRQDSTKSMMSGYVSGSALPRIILKDFKKMKLLIPDFGLMSDFETHIAPFYQSINLANRKIERLEEARDKLLPRLLSGKLSVEDLGIRFPPSIQQDTTAD